MDKAYEITINPELSHRHIENPCCSFFGCGRQLTREEDLRGDRCADHPKTKSIDVTKYLSFPIRNMEGLKIYNAELCKEKKTGKPFVRVNFDIGTFNFGKDAMNLIGLQPGEKIAFAYRKKTDEWLCFKDKAGFQVRAVGNEKNNNRGLIFNSAKTASDIQLHYKCVGEKSLLLQIGTEPETDENYTEYWVIMVKKSN